jgi:hypothetical protein
METVVVRTSAGVFGVVGQLHADRLRPALVAVSGSFPPKGHLHHLVTHFAGVSVLVVRLPGMGVGWSAADVPALTTGLEELIARLLGDTPLVLFGASTGNLLTLGARSPHICRRVALEPFFQTANLWPFVANARERMRQFPDHEGLRTYFWKLFGVTETSVENRDYRYLIEGLTEPTDVVAGQVPLLPERDARAWPSFLEEEERQVLRRHPLVTLHEGPSGSGHTYGTDPDEGQKLVTRLLHAALRVASERCIQPLEIGSA